MTIGVMFFLEVETYEEFINNILNTRGRFACGDEYHERHHIVPKCMDGGNDEENLIDLYAREHFIAHKMLALENPDNNSLVYAYCMMAWIKTEKQDRYELTPEEYEEAKIIFANSQKGKQCSEETRECLRQKAKEQMSSPEMRERLRQKAKEQMSNPEMIEILRQRKLGVYDGEKNPHYGKKHTDEAIQKISNAARIRLADPKSNPRYGTGRHVIQLSIDGEYIAEYISADEVQRMIGINRSSIRKCCDIKYKQQIAGGYKWMYIDDYEKLINQKET